MMTKNILRIRRKLYYALGKNIRNLFFKLRNDIFYARYLPIFNLRKAKNINVFYFIIDPKYKHHPGLADRLKAILGCYYIAKSNGYDFRIIDKQENGITEYMIPVKKDWIADSSKIEYSAIHTRFFSYSARCGINYKLTPNKQYHCYCYQGDDLFYQNGLEYINNFHNLYTEMFCPSDYMKNIIRKTELKEKEYVAVHARFINALESFESSRYPTLSEKEQQVLIKRCLNALEKICMESTLPVVMFSDSKKFLDKAKSLPLVILETKNISHMSFVCDKDSLAKTYLDFFLITKAAKAYRLCAPELRATNFSLYAAYAGGIEAEDIKV